MTMTDNDLVVDVRDVSRRFRVGSEDIWAVRDARLQVRGASSLP